MYTKHSTTTQISTTIQEEINLGFCSSLDQRSLFTGGKAWGKRFKVGVIEGCLKAAAWKHVQTSQSTVADLINGDWSNEEDKWPINFDQREGSTNLTYINFHISKGDIWLSRVSDTTSSLRETSYSSTSPALPNPIKHILCTIMNTKRSKR